VGGRWRRACASSIGVPTQHEAVHLCTFQVGCGAVDGRVVRAAAETALSSLRTAAHTVAGEDFPAFVTEAGVHGEGASVRVGSSQGVKGVFIGEDVPE